MSKKKSLFIAIIFAAIAIISINFYLDYKAKKLEPITYPEFINFLEEDQVSKVRFFMGDTEAKVFLRTGFNTKVQVVSRYDLKDTIKEYVLKGNRIDYEEKYFSEYMFEVCLLLIVFILFMSIISMIVTCLRAKFRASKNNIKKVTAGTGDGEGIISEESDSSIVFDDIAGLDEEKTELLEIVDFLKNPEKYQKLGARIPKGILLVGPPGTGKTLLAKAVAGEADVPFISTTGSSFVEKYVGVGAKRVRELFEDAREKTPSIIFIDEIDALGGKREDSDSGGDSERYQTLEQFLAEMDGFDSNTDIVVIGATNRESALDPAFKRPGRFDRIITVNLPDLKSREAILKIHAKNKPFMDDVSFEKIAYNTSGFSGAGLENLLNEAAILAARRNHLAITSEDISEAMRKSLVGLEKSGKLISQKEKEITAYHEAGHAIIGKILPSQSPIKEICIIPRGTAGGYTWHSADEEKSYHSKTEMKEKIATLLAGQVAEKIVFNEITTGASSDLEKATAIATEMVAYYGMSDSLGPLSIAGTNNRLLRIIGSELSNEMGMQISRILKEAQDLAEQKLMENRDILEKLAELLLEKETVYGDEFEALWIQKNTD